MTALIVIGRSGTAIAAELSRAEIGNEIDAMVVHGVDPSPASARRASSVALASDRADGLPLRLSYLDGGALSLVRDVSRSVFARHLATAHRPERRDALHLAKTPLRHVVHASYDAQGLRRRNPG
ncbi:MAG: ABC transporter permease [Acidobacteriota bacterium]